MSRTLAIAIAAVSFAFTGCVMEDDLTIEDDTVVESNTSALESAKSIVKVTLSSLTKRASLKNIQATNWSCLKGQQITDQYTLSWSGCQGGLPYACTETFEVVKECRYGSFVTISNKSIKHSCDYTYSGVGCEPMELPWM